MRISHLGVLTALCMTLTSAAVWTSTSPRSARANPATPTIPSTADVRGTQAPDRPQTVTTEAASSNFVTTGTLMMEGRLGHASAQAGADNRSFVFVEVRSDATARAASPALATPPVNLAIVVDRSGSMKGQRQRNALAAASGMIRRLRDGDTVSVVAYANQAELLVPLTTIHGLTRARLLADLRDDFVGRPRGNTCISCELEPADAAGIQDVASVALAYTDLGAANPDARAAARGELALTLGSEPGQLDEIVLSHLTRAETAATLQTANQLFAAGRSDAAQQLLGEQLSAVEGRAETIAGGAGSGHFARGLEREIDEQRGLLEDTKKDFDEASRKPSPKASKKAKSRIRLNAESSDALAGF